MSSFEAYPDGPGEDPYYHFYIVNPGDFVIKTMADIALVWQELCMIANEYPGAVPVFRLKDEEQ